MTQKLLLTAVLLGAMYLVLEHTADERLVLRADQVRVIDGDTIAVGETRYRLLGYDTPETKYAKCPEERRLGNRATRRLKELIGNARGIELDVRRRTDKYGRKLARAFVFGQDVAHTMITESLARPYAGGKRGSWCDVKEAEVSKSGPVRLPAKRDHARHIETHLLQSEDWPGRYKQEILIGRLAQYNTRLVGTPLGGRPHPTAIGTMTAQSIRTNRAAGVKLQPSCVDRNASQEMRKNPAFPFSGKDGEGRDSVSSRLATKKRPRCETNSFTININMASRHEVKAATGSERRNNTRSVTHI